MDETKLPTDIYALTLRRLRDNPTAIETRQSTVELTTLLGANETWVIQAVRVEGRMTVFVQFVGDDGGRRFVLPPEVVATIQRHGAGAVTKVRRRAARQAVATKREAGIPIGNAATLRKVKR
jgi:hypothetical protein